MAVTTYPHSIRFSSAEWRAVTEAAERLDMMPGAFVREAAARAAAEGLDLDRGRLAPELFELFKTTFRGVHVLAYLKRQELVELDRLEDFETAVEHAKSVQDETLGLDDEAEES